MLINAQISQNKLLDLNYSEIEGKVKQRIYSVVLSDSIAAKPLTTILPLFIGPIPWLPHTAR